MTARLRVLILAILAAMLVAGPAAAQQLPVPYGEDIDVLPGQVDRGAVLPVEGAAPVLGEVIERPAPAAARGAARDAVGDVAGVAGVAGVADVAGVRLARTGIEVSAGALLALALLLVGGGFLLIARRRARRLHTA